MKIFILLILLMSLDSSRVDSTKWYFGKYYSQMFQTVSVKVDTVNSKLDDILKKLDEKKVKK